MSRRRLFSSGLADWTIRVTFVCLAIATLALAPRGSANTTLKVDESNVKVLLALEPAQVLLPIENDSNSLIQTLIHLELVDPADQLVTQVDQQEDVVTSKTISIKLDSFVSKLKEKQRRLLPWLRLRYRLSDRSSTIVLCEGILALSRVAPELFQVRVAASYLAREGSEYQVRVQTINPGTNAPVAHVGIAARVVLQSDPRDVVLEAFGNTDAFGYTTLSYKVPPRFPPFPHSLRPAGGELHVIGQRGVLTASADMDVLVDQFPRILLTTDKPIYQPGQTVHSRALVLSPTRKVLTNETVFFRITDHGDTTFFQSALKTSRFGIVSIDWTTPANVKLGPYTIRANLSNDTDDWTASSTVMLTRYELPNFSVTAEPDRKYYLAGQDAEVKVNANYLFGQPVPNARVRLVRETDRSWNYEEQKWDIEEEESFEGETDANGLFIAKILLADQDEEWSSYERFRDRDYAAYVTDPSTNRTEQRRFDLRITKYPIHVYLLNTNSNFDQRGKLPFRFYVSTFYADGSPAECSVQVKVSKNGRHGAETIVNTNRYGVGLVSEMRLPRNLAEGSVDVSLTARDKRGKKGSRVEDVYLNDEDLLTIATDKSLYRAGQPIQAVIRANFDDRFIIVDLANDQRLLKSQRVRLRNHLALITFPYSLEFKDRLAIAAYPDFPTSPDSVATHTVMYPANRDLKVELVSTKPSYQPGETAQIDLAVNGPTGLPTESALGVVVIDQAVAERARTDSEFGGNDRSIRSFFGDDEHLGAISLNMLRQVNMSKAISADLDLVAGALLNQSSPYFPQFEEGDTYETAPSPMFEKTISDTLAPLRKALADHGAATAEYPLEETTLRRILKGSGLDFDSFRDPWGTPFRPTFSVERHLYRLMLVSAGTDKQFDTDDDFSTAPLDWPYFQRIGDAINEAARDYHLQTGGFIRDERTLRDELKEKGVDLETLRDPWGSRYIFSFDVAASYYTISVKSVGHDRIRQANDSYSSDDFSLWLNSIDYFSEWRDKIGTALKRWTATHKFPVDRPELKDALAESHIDLSRLFDAWGHPYEVIFSTQTLYTDRLGITNQPKRPDQVAKIQITPVTRNARVVSLRSAGADGMQGTQDDFQVASFTGDISEEAASGVVRSQLENSIVLAEGGGAIAGFVTDAQGAAVANATVSVTFNAQTFQTTTREDAAYSVTNLAPGVYEVSVEAAGFKKAMLTGIAVSAGNITNLNVTLEPGETTETVQVSSSAPSVETRQIMNLPLNGRNFSVLKLREKVITKSGTSEQSFTPRLREYFPETLVWQPELTTNKDGRAHVSFKLADNITTWKMSVIGSNERGEVGTTETNIRAFQPFFAELDPPRVLTQGDQISLPVVLRNYLNHKQAVELELKPESWFTVLGAARKQTEVPAGAATKQTFDLQAIQSIQDGKQRLTAIANEASDAIEKQVTVHPDGQEKTETVSDIISSSTALTVNLPSDTIPDSAHVELKLYPNLMAHVWESVEGIMQRPYGCAEQTISSSYASLFVLRLLKDSHSNSAIGSEAQRYLELGYQKLLGFQSDDGGFTYWDRGEPDVALTAYALRFLTDASDLIPVDKTVVDSANSWLLKKQSADGAWVWLGFDAKEDPRRTDLLTAQVARSLAAITSNKKDPALSAAIDQALTFLGKQSDRIDEPYLIASYSLASSLAGHKTEAARANERLRSLAKSEAGAIYWSLETNTPFYGWGLAGRIETTALAVNALLNETNDPLAKNALLFLLRNKDEYGVWYSTQATVSSLASILAYLSKNPQGGSGLSTFELGVNGHHIKSLSLPEDDQLVAPQILDLTGSIQTGTNRIELQTIGKTRAASVEVVSNYYTPWKQLSAEQTQEVRSGHAELLRLQTTFSKRDVRVMEEITCHVKAERVGFHGYGMLLAEIGLPPGADVDRASLETAMRGSEWSINQYDVLPDRIIVYLWPRAGGSEFSFKFRPRFAMSAKAAASSLYDYYNPEARAIESPGTFVVR